MGQECKNIFFMLGGGRGVAKKKHVFLEVGKGQVGFNKQPAGKLSKPQLKGPLGSHQTPLSRLQGNARGISSGIRALSAHGLARAKSTRPNPAAGRCRRRELLLTAQFRGFVGQ